MGGMQEEEEGSFQVCECVWFYNHEGAMQYFTSTFIWLQHYNQYNNKSLFIYLWNVIL